MTRFAFDDLARSLAATSSRRRFAAGLGALAATVATAKVARAVDCPDPFVVCGDTCAVLDSDPAHCGACDTRCADGQRCLNGACIDVSCADGLTDCNGFCRDLSSDPLNCGGCHNPNPFDGEGGAPEHGRYPGVCVNGQMQALCDDGYQPCATSILACCPVADATEEPTTEPAPEPTEAPTDTPTEEPAAADTSAPEPTDTPTPEPDATDEPTAEPTETPTEDAVGAEAPAAGTPTPPYAVVRRYKLSASVTAATLTERARTGLAPNLRDIAGFRSFDLYDAGTEAATVAVFDGKAGGDAYRKVAQSWEQATGTKLAGVMAGAERLRVTP